MSTLDEIIEGASLPEKTVPLCLKGKLVGELDEAERDLAKARSIVATSLSDGAQAAALQARVDDLRAQVSAAVTQFRLRGIDPNRWSELVTENPPRPEHPEDRVLGYNVATFFDALVAACLYDPVVELEQIPRITAVMSAGQWDALVDAALTVSRRKVDVPFSPADSQPTEDSA